MQKTEKVGMPAGVMSLRGWMEFISQVENLPFLRSKNILLYRKEFRENQYMYFLSIQT